MTRKHSVHAATCTAKDSVRHAAEVVAPYAGTAKDAAAHYAHEARVRLAPMVADAAHQARAQYDVHLQPRLEHAREALPPKLDHAAARARAAAEPVRDEALSRGTAALAALRGEVSAAEVEMLVRKRSRGCRVGRAAKRLAVVGLLAGAAFVAWKWWDKQANPDWLVEPPEATEPGRSPLTSVDGSAESSLLDPEVRAKQAKDSDDEPGDTA
ncbi:nosiheptide resistance regulatory protein [Streptomyces sp. NRRL B-1568]|nr:nosiheptide resistance regulatory protein [Streptomyces sp. NRRL B-1568]